MARIAPHSMTNGFSGKFGDMIFKRMRGKTFVSVAPRKPARKRQSAAQRRTRTNFQDASVWASTMMLDPERKAFYQKRAKKLKLPNAYTAAVKEYMRSVNKCLGV